MDHETEEFKGPFIEQGYEPEKIFYFGESVLLPEYRGQGIGVAFFDHREGHAREHGRFTHCCFCAVERPSNHPLRPSDYQPLDQFWHNRGYRKVPELATTYTWKDVDQPEETAKPMTFWLRRID
jgi:GNAT superfamily N-acetyltransferase